MEGRSRAVSWLFGKPALPAYLVFLSLLPGKSPERLAEPPPAWPQQWVSEGLQDGDEMRSPTSWATKRRQRSHSMSLLCSYSWKRELRRAQAHPPIMTNSGQSISWSPAWDIAHSTCPHHALPSHVEGANQATVLAAGELCCLSHPTHPETLILI